MSSELADTPDTGSSFDGHEHEISASLEDLRERNEQLLQSLARVQAEYANYRKRSQAASEQESFRVAATLAASLLPVFDDLSLAREHADVPPVVEAILDRLTEQLSDAGLRAFAQAGDAFDPQVHEALAVVSSPDVAPNVVVSVFQKGYFFRSSLLRPARVQVSE